MSLLVAIIVILIVAALLLYAVDLMPQLAPMNGLIKLLIILVAVLVILSKAGMI
jgi:hypothetical protein